MKNNDNLNTIYSTCVALSNTKYLQVKDVNKIKIKCNILSYNFEGDKVVLNVEGNNISIND